MISGLWSRVRKKSREGVRFRVEHFGVPFVGVLGLNVRACSPGARGKVRVSGFGLWVEREKERERER